MFSSVRFPEYRNYYRNEETNGKPLRTMKSGSGERGEERKYVYV